MYFLVIIGPQEWLCLLTGEKKQNKTKKTGFIDFVTAKTIQRIQVKVQTF